MNEQTVTTRCGQLISNSSVFSCHLNYPWLTSCRKGDGRLLHTRGPPTAKLLSTKVLCVRGTTDVLSAAHRRRRRPLSATRLMSSAKTASMPAGARAVACVRPDNDWHAPGTQLITPLVAGQEAVT